MVASDSIRGSCIEMLGSENDVSALNLLHRAEAVTYSELHDSSPDSNSNPDSSSVIL